MTLRKDRKRIAPDNKYIGITMMKSDLVLKNIKWKHGISGSGQI